MRRESKIWIYIQDSGHALGKTVQGPSQKKYAGEGAVLDLSLLFNITPLSPLRTENLIYMIFSLRFVK